METSHFLGNYVILAAILNFWTSSGIKRHHYVKTVNGFVFYIKFGYRNKSFWKKWGDFPNPRKAVALHMMHTINQKIENWIWPTLNSICLIASQTLLLYLCHNYFSKSAHSCILSGNIVPMENLHEWELILLQISVNSWNKYVVVQVPSTSSFVALWASLYDKFYMNFIVERCTVIQHKIIWEF